MPLDHDIRAALTAGEFELHYQPLVDLRTGTFSSVEALLRWPRWAGEISDVIDVAEQSDLILDLGAWVLERALAEPGRWHGCETPAPPFVVCVNVSTRQLVRPGFVTEVARLLAATGTEPAQLGLEITETALADPVEPVVAALTELRELGVQSCIDDFGTGHASLTYLAKFPVDVVKIDSSFVVGLGRDAASEVIVRSVIDMAHALQMTVVAEGVETLGQLEFLLDAGCDVAQGFLFSRPVPRPVGTEIVANAVPWPVEFAGRHARPRGRQPLPAVAPSRRYRLMLDLARDVTGRLDLADVLSSSFVALRQLVHFTGGSIQLVEDARLRLAATDPPATPEALTASIPLGQGVGGQITTTGEPRYLPDITLAPEVSPGQRARSVSGGVRSYFGVPLITAGEVIGVLQIDSLEVDAFAEEDRVTVLAFTPILAAAVQNARLFARERTPYLLPLPRQDPET
ncbi:MAG: EAL domain-containing protein [Mycobacteriales bacterium]